MNNFLFYTMYRYSTVQYAWNSNLAKLKQNVLWEISLKLKSLRSLTKNEQMSESLICLFFCKKKSDSLRKPMSEFPALLETQSLISYNRICYETYGRLKLKSCYAKTEYAMRHMEDWNSNLAMLKQNMLWDIWQIETQILLCKKRICYETYCRLKLKSCYAKTEYAMGHMENWNSNLAMLKQNILREISLKLKFSLAWWFNDSWAEYPKRPQV